MEDKEMSPSINQKLKHVKLLMNEGNYKKALELIETISSNEFLSIDDKIDCLLLESLLRTSIGELRQALSIVEEVLSTDREKINPIQVLDAIIAKTEISWRLGNLDEGLHSLEEGEGLLVELGNEGDEEIKKRRMKLLNSGGIIHWYRGNLDQALALHEQNLAISEEENDNKGIAHSLNNLGLVYQSKGEFNLALEYYLRSYNILEDIGDKNIISRLLNNIGNIYCLIGDHEKALQYLQKNYEIRVKLDNKNDIAMALINLGVIYRMQGDLSNALEYYQRGQRIYEEMNDAKGIALALNNLGDVYQLKGDLNLALEYYQESLAIYEELGIKQDIAMSLGNIGELYRTKRNLDWALRYYNRSLVLYEELKNDPSTTTIIYELFLLALDCDDFKLAQQHLKKLKLIKEKTDSRIVQHRYLIANALFLKSQKRTRQKMKAEEILAKIVKEEVVDHSLTVTAMIHLCDLLLYELKMTGEEEILNEVKELTEKLLGIAKQQSSHSLLAETYVLQSKLALLEMDIRKAQNLLEIALLNAEDKGLRSLAIKIYSEKSLLDTQIEKWKYLIKNKAPLGERLELTRLEELIERVANKQLDITEEEVKQYNVRAKNIGKTFYELPKRKYKLKYLNLLKDYTKVEKTNFRVAIAQIGLSNSGDILNEFYTEKAEGLFILKKEQIENVRTKVKNMIEFAHTNGVNILLFPELTIDLNYNQLLDEILEKAKIHNMYIIPGSFHDLVTKKNISMMIGPAGTLWQQEKHIPAIIHFRGRRFKEGIEIDTSNREIIVGNTEYGTIAIVICRDFLDMDLRVELKNSETPVDLIFNPAFTPVTDDFRAVHFDARRSIFAYCFFANIAEIGDSFIFTPERERVERKISAKEESLIYKDVDLFRLRSERKKWEIERTREKSFIQSTRS